MPPTLDRDILEIALIGLEAQKEKILAQIRQVKEFLNGSPAQTTATDTSDVPTGKRKKFSAASRRKMALAQKARWAKLKGESEAPESAPTPKPKKAKRRMSKEGLARIVAATKARWERVRLEKAEQEKAKSGRKKTGMKKARKSAIAAAA